MNNDLKCFNLIFLCCCFFNSDVKWFGYLETQIHLFSKISMSRKLYANAKHIKMKVENIKTKM